MKTIKRNNLNFQLIIIAVFFPFLSVAQDYFPFPKDSAVWYSVRSWPEYDPPPPVWYSTTKFEANGDTTINDIIYTQLFSSAALDRTPYYHGAYRVDSLNERVYFIDEFDNTETLLYDFKLVPGDTIIISGSQYEPYNLICIDTSSMIINDVPHQSYLIYSYLSNGVECYTTWIKGIGSLRIPIETDWFCAAWFEGRFDLSCFYYKEEQIYEWIENPYFEGCIGTNVGINELQTDNRIRVKPNPVTHTSSISYSFNNTLIDYQIIDLKGKLIKREDKIEISNLTISNQEIKNGIYILKIYSYDNEKYFITKFVIK